MLKCCKIFINVMHKYLHGHIFGKPTVLLEKAAACIASTVKASCIGLRSASSISKLKHMGFIIFFNPYLHSHISIYPAFLKWLVL